MQQTTSLLKKFCEKNNLKKSRKALINALKLGCDGYRIEDSLYGYTLYEYDVEEEIYLFQTHVCSIGDALSYIYGIDTDGQFKLGKY